MAPELPPPEPTRGRASGRSARRLHFVAAVGLATCVVAFVVEVGRAISGNGLSWVYVAEWPLLFAFGTYLWWQLLHGRDGNSSKATAASAPRTSAPAGATTRGARTAEGPQAVEDADGEALARWQAYQRQLAEQDRALRDGQGE